MGRGTPRKDSDDDGGVTHFLTRCMHPASTTRMIDMIFVLAPTLTQADIIYSTHFLCLIKVMEKVVMETYLREAEIQARKLIREGTLQQMSACAGN
jgi:hypothetical protein